MIDAPSIGNLCYHARHACMMSGLIPVSWRWSIGARLLFQKEIALGAMTCGLHELPVLPPDCIGLYEGLPVYHMTTLPPAHIAVACIGSREKPAF